MITNYETMLQDIALRQAKPGYDPDFRHVKACDVPKDEPITMPKDETSINTKKERRFQALGMIIAFRKTQ